MFTVDIGANAMSAIVELLGVLHTSKRVSGSWYVSVFKATKLFNDIC